MIGVNNRNLKTMTTDLSVSERLATRMPDSRPFVAESGIKTIADIHHLKGSGAAALSYW